MTHRHAHILAFLVAAGALTAPSCTDIIAPEPQLPATGDLIEFHNSEWNDMGARSEQPDSDGRKLVEIIPAGVDQNGDSLFFHVYVEDMPAPAPVQTDAPSRATPLRPGYFYLDFKLLGYKYPAKQEWADGHAPDFIYGDKMTWQSDSRKWTSTNEYTWPGSLYKVRFFGVMPFSPSGTLSPQDYTGNPYIDFTINVNAKNQSDLAAACTDELPGNYRKPVKLQFEHIVSTLKFETDTAFINGTVKWIWVDSIACTARYNLVEKQWSKHSNKQNMYCNFFHGVVGGTVTPISEGDKAIFVIPQELGSTAALRVAYADSANVFDGTIKASLKGRWEAGKTYTYRLSMKSVIYEPDFRLQYYPTPKSYKGVSSYVDFINSINVVKPNGTSQTVRASADLGFYDFNAESGQYDKKLDGPPSWLTFPNGYKDIGSQAQFTVKAQKSIDITERKNDVLRAAAPRGTNAAPWNLANATGAPEVENTANCYIVNAPGVYSLPLVYGNAIVDGKFNEALHNELDGCSLAFGTQDGTCSDNPTAGWPNVLHPYPVVPFSQDRKFKAVNLTKPYIIDYAPEGVAPEDYTTGSGIGWQDYPNLVTNVRRSDDCKSLIFEVPAENIRQGNAVVYVNVDGYFHWCWHIWVTDFVSGTGSQELQNQQGTLSFMPVNLGWVDESTTCYPMRKVKVVATQRFSNRKVEFFLEQSEYIALKGHSPYWQWGCPIPRMPDMTCYDSDGNATNTISTKEISVGNNWGDRIAHFFGNFKRFNTRKEMDGRFVNLWSWKTEAGDVNYEKVVKSIYDPCPVGYVMPYSGAFSGTTLTGGRVDSGTFNPQKDLNTRVDRYGYNGGWDFWSGLKGTGGSFFFPCQGSRTSGTAFYKAGTKVVENYYWTAGAAKSYTSGENVSTQAYAFSLAVVEEGKLPGRNFDPAMLIDKSTGALIRPCVEQK